MSSLISSEVVMCGNPVIVSYPVMKRSSIDMSVKAPLSKCCLRPAKALARRSGSTRVGAGGERTCAIIGGGTCRRSGIRLAALRLILMSEHGKISIISAPENINRAVTWKYRGCDMVACVTRQNVIVSQPGKKPNERIVHERKEILRTLTAARLASRLSKPNARGVNSAARRSNNKLNIAYRRQKAFI